MSTDTATVPEATLLVRYTRNVDTNQGTAVLKFHDDDRPDLELGQAGYVTEEEFYLANASGAVLEQVTEADLKELNVPVPQKVGEAQGEQPLEERPAAELRQIAADEEVDVSGLRSKKDIAEAIQAKRASQPEGAASLPATATGTAQPVVGSTPAGSGTTSSPSTAGTSGPAS